MVIKKDEDLECFGCHNGIMEKIKNPHSYDFGSDGKIFCSCNNCGLCRNAEEFIPQNNHVVLTRFSNHFIERVLKIICNRGRNFSYDIKKTLEKRLKNRNIGDVYNLVNLIIIELNDFNITIDTESILLSIYGKKFGAYLNMNCYAK